MISLGALRGLNNICFIVLHDCIVCSFPEAALSIIFKMESGRELLMRVSPVCCFSAMHKEKECGGC